MTWVYEELISFILSVVGGLLSFFAEGFIDAFSINSAMFVSYIPYFDNLETVISSFGITIVLVITLFSLLRNLFAPVLEVYENPLMLGVRFVFAIIASIFAKDILQYEWVLMQGLYSQIASTSTAAVDSDVSDVELLLDPGQIVSSLTNMTTLAISAVIMSLVAIVLLGAILIDFVKLLLEAAERYIVINLLMVFAPFGFATLASKNSQKICMSYIKMMFNQLLLVCMNIIFINGTIQMLKSIGGDIAYTADDGTTAGSIMLFMLLCIAFMKAGMRVDAYMRSLGLDVVQTGGSILDEVMGSLGTMQAGMRGIRNGISGAINGQGLAGAISGLAQGKNFNGGIPGAGFVKSGSVEDATAFGNQLGASLLAGRAPSYYGAPAETMRNALQNGNAGSLLTAMNRQGQTPIGEQAKLLNAATGNALKARIGGGLENVSNIRDMGNRGVQLSLANGANAIISGKNGAMPGAVPIGNGLFMKNEGAIPLGNPLENGKTMPVSQFIGGNSTSAGAIDFANALGIDSMNQSLMDNLMGGTIKGSSDNGGVVVGANGQVLGAVQAGQFSGIKSFNSNHGLDQFSAIPAAAMNTLSAGGDMKATAGAILSGQQQASAVINGKAYNANAMLQAITDSSTGNGVLNSGASIGLVQGVDSDSGYGIRTGDGQVFGINQDALDASEILPERSQFDNDATCAAINQRLGEYGAYTEVTPDNLSDGSIHMEEVPNVDQDYLSQQMGVGLIVNDPESETGLSYVGADGSISHADMGFLENAGIVNGTRNAIMFDDGMNKVELGPENFFLADDSADMTSSGYVEQIGQALENQKDDAQFNASHFTTVAPNIDGDYATPIDNQIAETFEESAGVGTINEDGQRLFAREADYSNLPNGFADLKLSDEKEYRYYDLSKFAIEGKGKLETIDIAGSTYAKVEGQKTADGFIHRGIDVKRFKNGFGGFIHKEK